MRPLRQLVRPPRPGDQNDFLASDADGTAKHRLTRGPAAFDFAPDCGSHP